MKLFRWDYIFCMLVLYSGIWVLTIITDFKMFEPLKRSITDFRITDIVDSKIIQRDHLMADTNIVLVNTVMRNSDLSNLGLAKIIHILNQYEPKAIGIKTFLRTSDIPKQDEILAQVLSQCDNLIMANKLTKFNKKTEKYDSIINSNEFFTQNAILAYDNFMEDAHEEVSTIRSFFPEIIYKGDTLESFAAQTVKLYDPEAYEILKNRNNRREHINYLGHYQFFRIEPDDVLEQNFEPDFIKDKIVILGRITTRNAIDSNMSLEDVYFTSINDTYAGKAFPDMYGSIIQANIVSMILNKTFFGSMPDWLIIVISLFFVYINMILFTYIYSRNRKWYEIFSLGIFVVESIVILSATIIFFINFSYEMNLSTPILSIAMSIIVYELYISSIKTITIRLYYKFIHKGY